MIAGLLALLLAAPAHAEDPPAEEAAPEFLLGDVGVRVDLPDGWNMTRWSDWDFKAETTDRAIALFAWTTPTQAIPVSADLEAWGALYQAKAEELGGAKAEVLSTRIATHHGLPTADVKVGFTFGNGASMALYGAAVPVHGQVFHLATVATKARAKRAESARDELVEALEILRAAADADTSPQTVDGITTTLPEGFRAPLELELAAVVPRLVKLGVEDPASCSVAIRPHGPDLPDVLATCQGGLWLGIVDDYTFEDKEAELRPHLFGRAEVPAATPIELPDRLGFHYRLDVGNDSLNMGVVPYDQGLARTWLIGHTDHAGDHAELLEATLASASYSGPHPVSLADRAAYVMYRPLWMAALVGLAVVLLALIGIVVMALVRRSGSKYEDIA